MRRRTFLGLAGAAAVFPRVALAQQAAKVPLVVWMSRQLDPSYIDSIRAGLADHGYVDGQNIALDVLFVPTDADAPAYAAKALSLAPAVIVTSGSVNALALKAATQTIPIVALNIADPLGVGLVASLPHPEANITGTSLISPDLVGKQISLIREIVPTVHRFAVPVFPADPITALYRPQIQAAAQAIDAEPVFVEFDQAHNIAEQFDGVISAGVQATFTPVFGELNTSYDAMYDLYLANRLPAISGQAVLPTATTPIYGVVHYTAAQLTTTRARGAAMVVAILGGTKPADIPFELPTLFDIGVNLDMAKKIGVTIPPDILAQATLVIDYDIRGPKAAPK